MAADGQTLIQRIISKDLSNHLDNQLDHSLSALSTMMGQCNVAMLTASARLSSGAGPTATSLEYSVIMEIELVRPFWSITCLHAHSSFTHGSADSRLRTEPLAPLLHPATTSRHSTTHRHHTPPAARAWCRTFSTATTVPVPRVAAHIESNPDPAPMSSTWPSHQQAHTAQPSAGAHGRRRTSLSAAASALPTASCNPSLKAR